MPDPALVSAFRAFATIVLVRLRQAVTNTDVKQRLRRRVVFTGEDFHEEGDVRPNYWPVSFAIQNAELWNDPTVETSVKAFLDACVLFLPVVVGGDGKPITDPTFDDMKPELVRDLMSPLLRLIEERTRSNLRTLPSTMQRESFFDREPNPSRGLFPFH
jgi:hypothetical protein